ncbi:MAG TPA: ExeM/NucH family extracellular endonuclease [Microbacterium sp.]|nr:ExeM/NucH family extracellular endonuclease [Microbacterium sp.]
MTAPAVAADGEDLFISEYIEGSSNNKAVEIFNPTGAPVDLAAYKLQMYANGAAAPGVTIPLTGTLAAGEVYVVAHGSANAAILAQADLTNSSGWFNGNDAVALATTANAIVDVIGQVGVDPGTQWGTPPTSTLNSTLQRLGALCAGDPNAADAFDPAVQWAGFASDTFTGLGWHLTDNCGGNPGPDPEPEPGDADCDAQVVTIGSVQGAGAVSPVAGQNVRVEGVVVGDFQTAGGLDGYFLQDAGDGDAATSDGIFIYAPGGADVATGDVVHVSGAVSEFSSAGGSLTEITAASIEVCETGAALPAPVAVELPAGPELYETLEGMSVTFPQSLSILEYFEYGRFGSIDVGLTRQMQPTAVFEPGSAEATALVAQNARERITLDDGRGSQNPDPALHPNGSVFSLTNTFRGGDLLTGITGVIDYRFGGWTVQPTQGAEYSSANPRPEAPQFAGDITVSSFNVLNYFTTLTGPDARGANDAVEFERQESKIVAALAEIDADVFGLIEIENNGLALETLTAALNEYLGEDAYDYVETGPIGTDVITTALIYKTATVTPVGEHAVLTSAIDPNFRDNNRPALAQTFEQVGGSEPVTVVVNHLKSKGSDCNALGDPDLGDGAANCNITRTLAATALANWLATDPTGQGADGRELIIGDLNSYDKEDPIDALTASGYTDLLLAFQGENAYSYVFDGQLGYLDYALAGAELLHDVTGADVWRINADEPSLIDYDMEFKQPAQDALFAPDPYRSSDHDPVVVGLDLTPPDTTPPTITAEADPELLWPPNGKPRTVTIDVDAADDSGQVTVELISTTATGHKKVKILTLTDTTFSVTAQSHAVYTMTYRATDAAGNTATATAVVRVAK